MASRPSGGPPNPVPHILGKTASRTRRAKSNSFRTTRAFSPRKTAVSGRAPSPFPRETRARTRRPRKVRELRGPLLNNSENIPATSERSASGAARVPSCISAIVNTCFWLNSDAQNSIGGVVGHESGNVLYEKPTNDMASREKKVSLNRKQATSSPVPQKDASSAEMIKSETSDAPNKNPRNRNASIAKQIKRKVTKKVIKKTIIGIKAKSKKLNQRMAKKILKSPEVKKSLLKNGIKSRKAIKKERIDLSSPVLEPIFPINENIKKKRGRKDEEKKIKDDDDGVDEAIHTIISELDLPRKKKPIKKVKTEDSIEDVIGDLTALIKTDDIKSEPIETSDKTPKKISILKDLKKENIENKFEDQNKVIDVLDLNVAKKKNAVVPNRRHSIEEFPVSCAKANPNLPIFTNLPRSISPRSKRTSKLRQSAEKRSSPYSTRSDSPARILRNGKHRKLKDLNLLDGLDIEHRKRKRLCSDYSGSEVSVSKSGYESDSSFSDLASLHGVDTTETEIKKESTENLRNDTNEKLEVPSKNVQEDEQKPEQNVDTNSNVCESGTPESTYDLNPSLKVPDKSKILGIMKQTFNDIEEKSTKKLNEISPLCTNTFYGNKDVEVSSEKPLPQLTPVENPSPTPTIETIQNGHSEQPEVQKEEESPALESINAENEVSETIETTEEPTIPEVEEPIAEELVAEEDKSPVEPNDQKSELEENLSQNNVEEKAEPETKEEEKTENTEQIQEEEAPVKKDIVIVESPETLAIKETILKALGLQSLRAAEEAKQKGKDKESPKTENYTGTLKTVIKLNRNDRKRGKKLSLQKSRKSTKEKEDKERHQEENKVEEKPTTSTRERETSWKNHGNQSSDTAGALRKSHYPNRSNMADGSSEHTSDGDTGTGEDGKLLVIPEKASSFSIHPDRLCKDECSYCFGKFGLFDTPCHIAQMKSIERQDKILAAEKHLTRDSCLCDACYRHVDRKSNIPSYTTNKSFKRNVLVAPAPKENHCHVLGCRNESKNILRRKWIIKMRKNICKVINIDLDNPGLHSIPICDEHYMALEHLMTCAMCKRKLAKNHIHYLGQELNELNEKLNSMNIPVKLEDKPVVCKLCKYYATLALSSDDEQSSENFFKEYTRRLLHFHDVEHMNEGEVEEPILIPVKDKMDTSSKKKKKGSKSPTPVVEPTTANDSQTDTEQLSDQNNVPSSESRAESPSDYMVDYQTLIPNIAMECGSDPESKKEIPKKSLILKKVTRPETIKEAVEISKNLKVQPPPKSADIAVQRLGSNPSISVRQLFPGEEDLPLQGNIEFHNVKERTPEGWEKCTAMIQYDADTKHLWQELQKPYGNQSSFLRHLILLEKYFRNGDLVLSPNASHHSVNYSESVQNRLRAYDNTPTSSGPIQPLTMIPFNKSQKSNSGIITSKETQSLNIVNAANIPKNTPITINQLNNSGLLVNTVKSAVPPGLMPLQPGTSKPVTPLVKVPQPQKIKFPITKNWRPNLIPIDPSKKIEKRPGLVQVISGGKPYHITLEDYKKMCAIKRTFDLKQKKLQEVQKLKIEQKISPNSLLKSMALKKTLMHSRSILSPKSNDMMEGDKEESSLEKLDKQVEKLEMKLNEPKQSVVMILPKIPKSLTVIPQTVPRKPSRPSSPTLQIVPKPKGLQKS